MTGSNTFQMSMISMMITTMMPRDVNRRVSRSSTYVEKKAVNTVRPRSMAAPQIIVF